MAGTIPPIFTITADDHGGYVCVVSYTLVTLTVVTVAARLSTRWYIGRMVMTDDILLALATVLAILQSAIVQLAVDHGLGKKLNLVLPRDFTLYQKYEYTAQILLVATVACSKMSLGLLFKNLMTKGYPLRLSQALMAAIVGWGLSSIFLLAFKCDMPRPWDSTGRCLNQAAIFGYIGTLNILTDIGLILLPCTVLWKVQVSNSKRFGIMSLLSTRLLVCAATGLQIHYAIALAHSNDRTWANITSSMWDSAMMNLSIIATAIPSLGRFGMELQPTVNAFALTEQHGLRSNTDKYVLSSIGGGRFTQFSAKDHHRLGTQTSVQVRRRPSDKEDAESTQGLVGKDGIQQTIDVEVY